MIHSSRGFLVITLTLLVVIGSIGATVDHHTLAEFSDTETASGELSAASKLNNPGNPGNGNQPYNDVDGDGNPDGDPTIGVNELTDYEDRDVNLVIPEGVGPIVENGNKDISIIAGNITSHVDITGEKGDVTLRSPNGSVDVSGSNLTTNADQGEVRISANHAVTLDGARMEGTKNGVHVESNGTISLDNAVVDIKSDIGDIYLSGETVSAVGAELLTNQRSIEMTARSGPLAVDDSHISVAGSEGQISLAGRSVTGTGANVSTHKGPVQIVATESDGGTMDVSGANISNRANLGEIALESVGNMNLNTTTLRTANDASADLGVSGSVLFVEGIEINDADGSLTYRPSDVTVIPDRDDIVASEGG